MLYYLYYLYRWRHASTASTFIYIKAHFHS